MARRWLDATGDLRSNSKTAEEARGRRRPGTSGHIGKVRRICAVSWPCFRGAIRSRSTALRRGMQTLVHRGPDGQRHWVAPHGRVALGHTRLSIIDLVTGDQPIANEDERLHIIVNGEFYDYERIQRELIGSRPQAAHTFRQRDRPAPVRRLRHTRPAPSCAASSPSSCGTRPTAR